jgi:TonB-dependent receptor
MLKTIFSFGLFFLSFSLFSQNLSIKGIVTDEATGESLVGATIVIQGTYTGTITDLDGNFELKNVSPGKYNLVISYISYDNQIVTVDLEGSSPVFLDVKLKSASISVEEVTVIGRRKTDSEAAIVANIKALDVIASGISADQIKRSQDSDAAQVIKRVPGITITNGRFVIVRGLSERYSHVMLNRAPAPSFEADKKAFSFDAIPSGMIQNMMIYKSPAPELPADFAGAVIDIMTKEVADIDELKISYSTGYVENTTFRKDFKTYKGGKLDFLGFDDGTRNLPEALPSPKRMNELYVWPDLPTYYARMDSLQTISRAFNSNWKPFDIKPFLDQSLSIVYQKRFVVGKASLGNITSLNYKHSNSMDEILRKEYFAFDISSNLADVAYDYKDYTYKREANTGLISNWLLIYGNNQRIGFRNLLNNIGESTTTLRNGLDGYNSVERENTNLRFQQRFIYSGQVDGSHLINNNRTSIKWLAGYSFVSNNDPDNRRYSYSRVAEAEDTIPYEFIVDVTPSVYYGGRISQNLTEHGQNIKFDLVHDIFSTISNLPVQLKTGFYLDSKNRDFATRLVGVVAPRGAGESNLIVGDRTGSIEDLFAPSNFYYDNSNPSRSGFMYRDGTAINNSYIANDRIKAGYAGLKIPLKDFVEIYGGLRAESFNRKITGFYDKTLLGDTADIRMDTINIFPSVNLKIKVGQKNNIRMSYGKTTNRPEFRENSPIIYEDFDEIAIIIGNPDLELTYIHNYDIRFEHYPNSGEVVSLAFFTKKFINPVELFQIPAGTGWNYKPFNTEKATSSGLELDVRKSLMFLENTPVLKTLKNFSVVFNSAVIKSEINTDKDFARDSIRIMQGQSPYIINLGLFYNSSESGLMFNVNYNRIGKRIAYAGTPSHPHVWELPRNAVDITLTKKLGESAEIKFGVQDLLAEPEIYRGFYGPDEAVALLKRYVVPSRKISLGFSWSF